MTCHPLACRILASLGIGVVVGGCDSGSTYNCDPPPPVEEELVPGCVVEVPFDLHGEEVCAWMTLEDGECPALDSQLVLDFENDLKTNPEEYTEPYEDKVFHEIVCGPLNTPAQPSTEGQCCYTVLQGYEEQPGDRCIGGRPLLIAGEMRTAPPSRRRDWSSAIERAATDDRIAAEWLRDAAAEHASVASFARVSLELLALGAPAELVAGAHAAALDEIEHAKLCYAMARRYGAGDVGPGPLAIDGALGAVTLLSFVEGTLREGCVGETVAAFAAARAAERTRDPETKRVQEIIARDEERHAALAWRCVAWAIEVGGAPVRERVASFLAELETEGGGVAREAARLVVVPCARAVLAA